MAGTLYVVVRKSPRYQSVLALTHREGPAREEFSDEAALASVRAMLGEAAPSHLWVDVDARTGEILEILDPSRRAFHSLFDLLHRWEAPWLAGHEDIRRIMMAVWCGHSAGLAVSGFWIWAKRRSVSKVMR